MPAETHICAFINDNGFRKHAVWIICPMCGELISYVELYDYNMALEFIECAQETFK